jgi:EAL domain-containing protein (putative c-di-GMP-specific phosphodiesterase class I)
VLRASGEHETLSVMGLPFGALSRPQWQVGTVQLDVGDTLLVVSDGLLDHFGGDRSALREVAQIAGRLPAEVVPGHLADLAAADGQLNDDVTVLAVSRSDAAMTDLIEVSERAAEAPPIANVAWRTALQRVIDEPSRLRFDWQPIIDLASARVAGFELLSRFHGPWSAGPEAWFTAAHWWGFSAALHERVLSAGVSARVGLPEDVFVSVNLDPRLVGSLDGLRFGLHGLVIELTGQSRLVPDRRTADALRRIRSLGGTLAVDDGGTGYGAAQIQALAPEFLKLARSAVDGVDSDPAKRAGVEAARRLIGGVGGRVVAEGIETEAQLDALLALGVPLGQGYLIGRPVAQPSLVVPPAVVDRIRAARGGPGGPRHRRV